MSYVHNQTSRIVPLLALSFILIHATSARADHDGDHFWDNPGGGDFGIAANWLSNAVPLADDDARFTLDANYTVSFSQDHENFHFSVEAGDINLDLNGFTYQMSHNTYVGFASGDAAGLLIENGRVENLHGYIGLNAGAKGQVDVLGSSATWDVTSAGVSTIQVGASGVGALNVADNANINSSYGQIGSNVGSEGEATVTSGGAWTLTDNLTIGVDGTGSLLIDGGTVSNRNGVIAATSDSNGDVTVTGPTSSWTSTMALSVGWDGVGSLLVDDGATLTSDGGRIGLRDGTGMVTISGADTTWTNTGDAIVGWEGDGTLVIEDGASVSNLIGYIGHTAGSQGAVTVDDAMWTSWVRLYVGGEQAGAGGNGLLEVLNGGFVEVTDRTFLTGQVTIWDTGVVQGDGTLKATDFLNAGLVSAGLPGDGSSDPTAGVLTFDGDFEQTSTGTMQFGFGLGGSGEEFDQITVLGDLNLAGNLELISFDGYVPYLGQEFQILDWTGSLNGSFDNIFAFNDNQWDFSRLYTEGVVTFVPTPGASLAGLIGFAMLALIRRRLLPEASVVA